MLRISFFENFRKSEMTSNPPKTQNIKQYEKLCKEAKEEKIRKPPFIKTVKYSDCQFQNNLRTKNYPKTLLNIFF